MDAVKERVANLLTPLASEFNLSLTAFGTKLFSEQEAGYGTLTLTDAWGTALEPAPITPTDPDDAPYKLLSGSIKSSLLDSKSFRNTNATVRDCSLSAFCVTIFKFYRSSWRPVSWVAVSALDWLVTMFRPLNTSKRTP